MERVIKFVQEKDEKGRTILKPLTEADKAAMEEGLKNPEGIKIEMPEAEECPAEPEAPFELTTCADLRDYGEYAEGAMEVGKLITRMAARDTLRKEYQEKGLTPELRVAIGNLAPETELAAEVAETEEGGE